MKSSVVTIAKMLGVCGKEISEIMVGIECSCSFSIMIESIVIGSVIVSAFAVIILKMVGFVVSVLASAPKTLTVVL
jgi:hypothetical protein